MNQGTIGLWILLTFGARPSSLMHPTVREAKPSALQDFEAGRRCEIDAINGAVPLEAAKVGLEARTNQIVADIVRAKQSNF